MCFLFVSNPPQETLGIASSNPGSGCVAANARGAIQGTAHAVRVCEGASDSKQVRNEFVMLRAIDLHSRANCAEESWRSRPTGLPVLRQGKASQFLSGVMI
jgi:hypothetical protein